MKPRNSRLLSFAVTASALVMLSAVPVVASAASAAPRPAPAPVCQGPAVYKSDGTPWVCTFDDEFNGTTLDSSKWVPITTAGNGIPGGGSGTSTACYVSSHNNISVANGVLSLTARKEATPFTCTSPAGSFTTQYSTGQVSTYGKFSQTYGRFAIRAKFPAATIAGLQSALWMWPQNLQTTGLSGEIDIAEEYSQYPDRAIPTLHYAFDPATVNTSTDTNTNTNYYCMINNVNAFHEYDVIWTPTSFTFLYDGNVCVTDNVQSSGTSPFSQPYFLMLTQALGIGTNVFDPANTPLPATTQIDWVRVWK